MQARHDMTMDATVGRPRRARRWGRRGRARTVHRIDVTFDQVLANGGGGRP